MSNQSDERGIDNRRRERSGQIDHKHPATKIKHLREHYGKHFAPDWDGERTLGELLKETRFESLSQYIKHHGHHAQASDHGSGPENMNELSPLQLLDYLRRQPSFTISFDPDLSDDQVLGALSAMADYYRACGGIGLELDPDEIKVASWVHPRG